MWPPSPLFVLGIAGQTVTSCLGCRVSCPSLTEDHLASVMEAESSWESHARIWLMDRCPICQENDPQSVKYVHPQCLFLDQVAGQWENGKRPLGWMRWFQINISEGTCRWCSHYSMCVYIPCIIKSPQPICISHALHCGGKWFVYRIQSSEWAGLLRGSVTPLSRAWCLHRICSQNRRAAVPSAMPFSIRLFDSKKRSQMHH